MSSHPNGSFWVDPRADPREYKEMCASAIVQRPRLAPDQPDIKLVQYAAGNGKPIIFPLYYPTVDANAWDCGVSNALLKLIPGYDPRARMYNGLHYCPVAVRPRDDIYQPAIQPYKQALRGTWLGGLAIFIPNDKESAAGTIQAAWIAPEQKLHLAVDPVNQIALAQSATESDRSR
jgi:hypothetical protein